MEIGERLARSGERERLRAFLRAKLRECGWREEMKAYLRERAQQDLAAAATTSSSAATPPAAAQPGNHSRPPSVDWLIAEAASHAFAAVPATVKSETLFRIRRLLLLQQQGSASATTATTTPN